MENNVVDNDNAKRLSLSKKSLKKTYFWWIFTAELSNSYERLQALSFCVSMLPSLRELYKDDKEEYKAALRRHLQFSIPKDFCRSDFGGHLFIRRRESKRC